ncbi:O-antigen ligase family protein [Bacillus gobiensis]|uniref:O-antigen ligase family protein n=1 Tax=Bacillus gobiensis TaxID=1441095 RepID=UPI003D21E0D3
MKDAYYSLIQNQKMPLMVFIIICISLTASSDLFLVFQPGGFTLRGAQILTLLIAGWWAFASLQSGTLKLPLGSIYLLFWTFIVLATIPNTTFLTRSLGYAFWLLLNVLMLFAIVYFINSKDKVDTMFRWYIYSYLIISLFGILQFVMGIAGITPPFVTQWWIQGVLPRVNGFSYEPSYYATYLITGWVLVSYMFFESKTKLFTKKRLGIFFLIITAALILSSSRMGLVLMAIWLLRYIWLFIKGFLIGTVYMKYLAIVFVASLAAGVIVISLLSSSGAETSLLSGTGIGGTPAHSVVYRLEDFFSTLQVFLNNPIYGVSLGGVAPAIGQLYGVTVTDQEVASTFEGQSVFAEILAATGIIGFVIFIAYLITIMVKPFKLSKLLRNSEYSVMMRSMVFSLICLLLILQFNQNILRPYLWFHIALLSAIYSVSRKELRNK